MAHYDTRYLTMKIRLLRGQCVVREIDAKASIWTPDPNPRKVWTHRGIVVALGPPGIIYDRFEVPWGFDVGATIQYHIRHHIEAHTRVWPPDGMPALWIPQMDIDGVWTGVDN